MKLYELMEVLTDDTKVLLYDDDGEIRGEYDGKNSINERYKNVEISRVSVDGDRLVVEAETPTWKIKGTYTVEVEVIVTAFTEDDVYEIVGTLDSDDLENNYYQPEVEVYDRTENEIKWEDAEEY